jgi:DNA modification methylase
MDIDKIYCQDWIEGLKTLPDESINCVVTSPPYYGLRDYGMDKQLGLEKTPEEYVAKIVDGFREIKRVLKKDGTVWLNLGDSYWGSGKGSGQDEYTKNLGRKTYDYGGQIKNVSLYKHEVLKPKDLIGIPWMVAFALRVDGWWLRQDIIWQKDNPMPESVTDRCTRSHEYIFLLTKSSKYFYDYKAILEPAAYDGRKDTQFKGGVKYKDQDMNPGGYNEQSFQVREHERWPSKMARNGTNIEGHSGYYGADGHPNFQIKDGIPARNKRSVWNVNTKPFKGAHFATFPEELIVPCILAGCPKNGIVCDPFMGACTTAVVSKKLNRHFIGFELNQKYIDIGEKRMYNEFGMFI